MKNSRRDLFALAALGALPMAGATLPNTVIDPKDAKLTREPFGDLLIFFNGPTQQVKSMTAGSLRLKAGMEPHPPHAHPEEEFMVITEGSGELLVDGKTVKVGPGSMMYCGANKTHGIRNTGKTLLLFYFYKWQA
ncbi:MAG: cupin domain-containing protein [Acidobacteria bacterium]|nr:cupin domain-containing protein [Acidobacteriota bacterium]